ncbi:MAG: hypothetical protein GKS01_16270 [Alphaproteobacteria bacterium]|nr:hypothetical protein [Alphaproteobacteria bacterium]
MLNEDDVVLDVDDCMKAVIEASTGASYHDGLIPILPPEAGWEADLANWDQTLAAIQACLHAKNPAYANLVLDPSMTEETINKTLSFTRGIITAKIMAL